MHAHDCSPHDHRRPRCGGIQLCQVILPSKVLVGAGKEVEQIADAQQTMVGESRGRHPAGTRQSVDGIVEADWGADWLSRPPT